MSHDEEEDNLDLVTEGGEREQNPLRVKGRPLFLWVWARNLGRHAKFGSTEIDFLMSL
jgi:hypothetical protein